METEKTSKEQFEREFKKLFNAEIDYREKFRSARKTLESLVDPISKHNRLCCKFWDKHFPDNTERVIICIVNDGTKTAVEVTKPKLEPAMVESYLPFGIDFRETQFFEFL